MARKHIIDIITISSGKDWLASPLSVFVKLLHTMQKYNREV